MNWALHEQCDDETATLAHYDPDGAARLIRTLAAAVGAADALFAQTVALREHRLDEGEARRGIDAAVPLDTRISDQVRDELAAHYQRRYEAALAAVREEHDYERDATS